MSPQPSSPVAYTLQIISVNDLPPRRVKFLGERRNVHVKATIEDRSVQIKSRLCTSSPEWKETFQIEAYETSSVLSLQLFDSAFRSTSMICASEILISDLLQLCRHGKDAELDLRDTKSRLKGRITIHVSLSTNGSWIVDEAQRWALVLSQPPNTAMEATEGYIDNIDGLLAVSVSTVPPDAVSQSIVDVLDKLSHFMRIADEVAKVHPYAKLAWDVLSAAHKIIVAQVAIDQSVADLASTMQGTYSFVDALEAVPSKIPLLEDIIQRIFIQTVECAIFIREYSGHGFAGRLLRETMGTSTPAKVAGMAQNLISLRQQFDTGVAIQTATITFRTHKDVTDILKNLTFGRLGSTEVHLSNLPRCLPGTRRVVIDEIIQWALHPSKGDVSNVLWLYGVAGIGKTAVAATVAALFLGMGRLGAFVGFDRASPEKIQQSTAVQALARKLGDYDERLGTSIIKTINDRSKFKEPVLEASPSEQFDRLIVETFAGISALHGEGAIVIVLDSLDVCGQPNDQASLLEVIVRGTKSLPSNLRFIITSRTVNDIYAASDNTVLHPRLWRRELRSSSHADISAYFTFRMQQIRRKNTCLQEDWPGQAAIAELSARAFGFFPWAVNASNFVDAYCPPEQLEFLLRQQLRSISEPNPLLDELYKAALNPVGDWKDAPFVKDFRAIMNAIIASPIALSTAAINHLLNRPPSLAPAMVPILRRLGSVLTYEPVVQVLHPSFLYFLSSRERCGCDDWYFGDGPVRVIAAPATLYLERMNAGLQRNMCHMTLLARAPEELAYACQTWVDHMCTSGRFESWEMETLAVFLHTHLLHWFEVMSVLKKSEEIVPMLQRVATWLEEHFTAKSLENLVIEAIDLAHKFAADITGPATLYLQRLNAGLKRNICDMAPSARPISTEVLPAELIYPCQSWVDHIRDNGRFELTATKTLAVFLRTHILHWFEAMSILKKSGEIAPMLQRVVPWLEENTFEDKSLKDLVIEAIDFARQFAADIAEHPLYVYCTALPLFPSKSMLYRLFHDALVNPSIMRVSHPDGNINSMALSTDGLRLVTGYGSLAVWDTATGDRLLEIKTPTGDPCSAAFSYDGSRIACGTNGSTVYVWDSVSGAQVISPLIRSGSSSFVRAVAWSMDGGRLLSGCSTGEMNLWNVTLPKGSQPITKIHHPGCSAYGISLASVALSMDGSQIASCSKQGDMRVWDSKTGGMVWSGQDPQCSGRSISLRFLSSDMGAFIVAQTKGGTQVRDASTGDHQPLPDSLSGAVGLTCGDFMVNLLTESILKHYSARWGGYSRWAAQGQYFVFADDKKRVHIVHLPKLLV